jgi:hypothetical protein
MRFHDFVQWNLAVGFESDFKIWPNLWPAIMQDLRLEPMGRTLQAAGRISAASAG